VIIRIGAQDDASVDRIEKQIRSLMDVMESAECSMQRLDHNETPTKLTMASPTATVTDLPKKEKVLVLGSGLVSTTLVEYLGRDGRREVTVVGAIEAEARAVSKAAKNGRHVSLDIQNGMDRVAKLIEESDIVVSLLPAPMHSLIANACIDKSTDLVTASYESDAMRQLDER
jgi:alpha-aminoadipic semialdehyde synthase